MKPVLMEVVASKFIYPKDMNNLEEVLSPFRGLSLQLAFFQRRDFLKLNHHLIKDITTSLNINIPTIHAPTIDVFDKNFLEVLELIKKVYQVRVVTIHPQKGDKTQALTKLKEYRETLQVLDIVLAYENFPASAQRRKWITSPQDMYSNFNLPFLRLTFDTSHLDLPSLCVKELERVFEKVEVIHLSDSDSKRRHLPLGEGALPYRDFLRYLKEKKFSGFVVLEYLEEFEPKLLKDIGWVASFLLDEERTLK